jgi:hypothetical protein
MVGKDNHEAEKIQVIMFAPMECWRRKAGCIAATGLGIKDKRWFTKLLPLTGP